MKESLLIVAFFAAGILCGRFDLAPDFASSDFTSMALLCLLMVCVGISIGSNGRLREILRSLSPRVLLFPLATGLGTYAASAACCLFLGYSVWQCLAVGAGLGYYSLSSVLISQAGFIDIGTIALISNLIREAYALLLSPLVARFSPFAAISIGGCTTMDTTLPVMVSALGSDWAFTSIVHAIVLDFTVPFAVIFFCTRRYHIYKEGFLHNTLNRADFLHLNKLGWPIAMQMGMETASFSLSAIMVGWIGTTALAAHQVMLAISQICFMMYYGMGAAVAVRVSNFRGQNDRMNVRRSAYAGFHIMLLIALIGALPIFLLRNELGGWFSDSPAVSVMVAQLIIPFIIYQFGDGLQINFANALRGIADVKPMMYIAFIAYFLISLPAGYFFGFIMDWGIIGIWMAFPFGLTTAGILYYLRFNRDTKLK